MSRSAFVFKVVEFESPPVFDSDLSSIHPHQVVMNKWVIVTNCNGFPDQALLF